MAQCFFDGGNGDSGRLGWTATVPGAGMNNLAGPADCVQLVKRHTLPVQPIDHHRLRGAGAGPHHADYLQLTGTEGYTAGRSGAGSRTL